MDALRVHGAIERLKRPALWLAIIILAATVLFWLLDIKATFNPPYLLLALNILFIGIPGFFIAVMTARSFAATGVWPVLWLGIGALAFGLATMLGGLLVTISSNNTAVTISNLVFMVSAWLFILGTFFETDQVPRQEDSRQRRATLLQVYLGIGILVLSITVVGLRGLFPPFFTMGAGGTPLRQIVVALALALFLISAVVSLLQYRRSGSPLLYWYSLGLWLLALGMGGILVQTAIGTPLNWAGRISQYFGGIYLMTAVMTALREARARDLPAGETLAALLSVREAELREKDAALKESEAKYRNIVETADEGIWIGDTNARTIFVNKKMAEMLGYSREEVLGKMAYDFMDREAGDVARKKLERRLQGDTDRYEQKYTRKDGSTLWAIVSAAPILDDSGKTVALLGMITDITERKKAEEAVSLERDRANQYLDIAGVLILALDRDGKVTLINARGCEILGRRLEDVIGKNWADFMPERLKAERKPDFEQLISGNLDRVAYLENPVLNSRGEERIIAWHNTVIRDENEYIVGSLSSGEDITERKKAEAELAHLATFPELNPNPIVELDASGNVTYLNPSAKKQFPDLSSRGSKHPLLAGLEGLVKTVRSEQTPSLRREIKIGDDWYGQTVFRVPSSPNFRIYSGDINERKKIEQLKDEFISMVSHELKTPLTVIMGALYVAGTDGIPEEERRQLLAEAVAGSKTMAGIVDNLLELSRYQANRLELHPQQSDLGKIALEVVNDLKDKSARHCLVLDLPEFMPLVLVDPVRVERILFNLVENAIKYSPGGGEVNISARQENNDLVVCVRDQGPGISADDQKKLFQSFEQLAIENRRAMQGVGLGLKVCRTLVEAHGGRIWVESGPDVGSSFYFTLPIDGAVSRI